MLLCVPVSSATTARQLGDDFVSALFLATPALENFENNHSFSRLLTDPGNPSSRHVLAHRLQER